MRIRPYKPSDAFCLLEWLKDERITAFWKADRFSYPLTEQQLANYDSDFQRDANACLFTALDDDGVPCGHFSFRNIDYRSGSAHIGFIVTNPAARGTGLGKKMISLALFYARSMLLLQSVTVGVYDCNVPAGKCYEALGFRQSERASEFTRFYDEDWEYRYLIKEMTEDEE